MKWRPFVSAVYLPTSHSVTAERDLILLHEQLRDCQQCLTAGHAIIPGAVMSGKITAQVMTIGQAPGVTEVEAKRPFNAGSGRRLFQWLGQAGWDEADFRANQYMTSVTKCYPGKHHNGKGDRVPSRDEQALCRPFLEREIALVRPRVIIPIGKLAIQLFFPKKATLKQLIGTALFLPAGSWERDGFDMRAAVTVTQPIKNDNKDEGGRYIIPLPHPSGASLWPNQADNRALIAQAIKLISMVCQ